MSELAGFLFCKPDDLQQGRDGGDGWAPIYLMQAYISYLYLLGSCSLVMSSIVRSSTSQLR